MIRGEDFLTALFSDDVEVRWVGSDAPAHFDDDVDVVVVTSTSESDPPPGWDRLSSHTLVPTADEPRLALPNAPRRIRRSAWHLYRPMTTTKAIARAGMRLASVVGLHNRSTWPVMTVCVRDGLDPYGEMWHRVVARFPTVRFWASSLGTPGLGRKAAVRLMDADGTALALLKFGMGAPSADAVESEVTALERFGGRTIGPMRVPGVIDHGFHGDTAWLVQEHLGDPPLGQRARDEDVAEFCRALVAETGAVGRLGSTAFWQRMMTRTSDAASRSDSAMDVVGRLERREITVAAMHGDVAPWNMMGSDPAIFDWEMYVPDGPAMLDLVHWLVGAPMLLGRSTPTDVARRVLDGEGTRALLSVGGDHDGTVLGPSDLLILYLVDRILLLEREQAIVEDVARTHQIMALGKVLDLTVDRLSDDGRF